MTICILAMDGLEAKFVEKWKLRNLLQEYHGTISLNNFKEKYGRIHSLEIWTAFLTGKMPEKTLCWYKVRASVSFAKKILRYTKLYGIAKKIFVKYKPGVLVEYQSVKKYGLNALPDKIQPSATVDMILYDKYGSKFRKLARAINKDLKEYEEESYRQFRERMNKLKKLISGQERYRLILAYFRLADNMGHVFSKHRKKVFQAYLALDRLAYLVRRRYRGVVLIMSDHGMNENGEHSMESFWSLNTKPPFTPRSIIELHDLVLKLALEANPR